MPSLAARLLPLTQAHPGMLLLYLSRGRRIVLQAALQSGCTALGLELMERPGEIACEPRIPMTMGARMWGVRMGDVELEHANMLKSPHVNELMVCADVVLVNKASARSVSFPPLPYLDNFSELNSGIVQVTKRPGINSSTWRTLHWSSRSRRLLRVVGAVCRSATWTTSARSWTGPRETATSRIFRGGLASASSTCIVSTALVVRACALASTQSR